jgi:hypothetical protein
MSPEEKETRKEFRRSLTAEQRATMAIGVVMLNWAYWDGDITQHIFSLKEVAERRKIDVSAYKVLSLHKERLKTLRRLILALTTDGSDELRKYDAIFGKVAPLTVLRGAIAHGLMGLGNPSATPEDLRLVVLSSSVDPVERVLLESGPLDMPSVAEVFEAADVIWDEREKLRRLVHSFLH